jgi:hypothetical protein
MDYKLFLLTFEYKLECQCVGFITLHYRIAWTLPSRTKTSEQVKKGSDNMERLELEVQKIRHRGALHRSRE